MEQEREETLDRLAFWSFLFIVFLLLVCWVVSFGITQAKAEEQRKADEAYLLAEQKRAWIASEALAHQRSKDNWANVMAQLKLMREEDERKRIEAEEAAYQEWLWQQSQYWYEPQTYSKPEETGSDDGWTWQEFQFAGVIEEGGRLYTYYSQNVLPGAGLTELNSNGRHVEDGFVKDGDGYIAVASSDEPMGTVIDTPFGQGKVYDTGYLQPGQVDIYVAF